MGMEVITQEKELHFNSHHTHNLIQEIINLNKNNKSQDNYNKSDQSIMFLEWG